MHGGKRKIAPSSLTRFKRRVCQITRRSRGVGMGKRKFKVLFESEGTFKFPAYFRGIKCLGL